MFESTFRNLDDALRKDDNMKVLSNSTLSFVEKNFCLIKEIFNLNEYQ